MGEANLIRDITFPFDREKSVSLELLFNSFCNHITLGQWELARVCLRSLSEQRQQLGKPLKEILRALIDQPLACCKGSLSLESPYHLTWVFLMEYLDLYGSEELPKPFSQMIEFRLLLHLTCVDAPKHLLQEFDSYYCKMIFDEHGTGVSTLPSSTLNFLKQLLNNNPEFAHALITALTGKGKSFLENNQLLQTVYTDSIEQYFAELDHGETWPQMHDKSGTIERFEKPKQCIYRILSLMNPTHEMTGFISKLNSLFENLLQRTKISDPRCLDKGKLYSSLIRTEKTFLIYLFCAVENRLKFMCETDEYFPCKDLGCHGTSNTAYSTMVQVCYLQSHMNNRQKAWELLYFHSLKQNHVLDNIVETALLFVKEGMFDKVTQLLSPLELQMLKPLVLLMGWRYCYSCENAQNLLDALWDNEAPVSHPVFHQACQKLAYQVQLVQWCLEKAQPLLASAESGSTRHQQASQMFQGLESHSVLHVLDRSISLAHLPEKEVFSLLKKRPVFNPSSTSADTSPTAKSNARVDTRGAVIGKVNIESIKECNVPSGDGSESLALHPEVERDVVIYHSFCALRNFMESITQASSSLSRNSDQSYAINDWDAFLEKLREGRRHLSEVYPLTYRVEILEDIFSLLFVTYEELYDERSHHDSDDLDTADEETKSLNTSLTGSMKSLVSITSTEQQGELSGKFSPLKDKSTLSPAQSQTSESSSRSKSSEGFRSAKRPLFQAEKPEPLVTTESIRKTLLLAPDSHKPKDEPRNIFRKVLARTCCEDPHEYEDPAESRVGFVVSDEKVLEYLKTVKEALMELNVAKLQCRQDIDGMKNSPDWIRSSVFANSLDQRVSRLGKYIGEAEWRHQLVSWTDPTRPGNRERPKKRPTKYQRIPENRVWTEVRDGEETKDKQASSPEGGARGPESDVPSEESSAYLSQDLTTVTEDNFDGSQVRKKRRKTASAPRASLSEGLVVMDSSIIARMLSPPDTLIYMCMRKGSYDRAHQVIKMFQLQDKPSAQAALFANKYSVAFKQLSSLQPRSRKKDTRPSTSKTLGAVAMAAASGVTSSLVSNVIDELLTLPNLEGVMLPGVVGQEESSEGHHLSRFVGPDLVPVMVCLDLACTANVPWEVCKTLLDTAASRLKDAGSPTKSETSVVGIVAFLSELRSGFASETDTQTKKPSTRPNLVDILLTGNRPVCHKSREYFRKCDQEQENSLHQMEHALEEGDQMITSAGDTTRRGSPRRSRLPGGQVERAPSVRVSLAELQRAFDCIEAVGQLVHGTERLDYIRSLTHYVDTLATHLLHWQTHPSDEVPSCIPESPVEKSRSAQHKASNPFVVLGEGIAETLGKPMFEKNVSPERLETVSKQLHVNLVKVIVHNCCPPIPVANTTPNNVVRWPSSTPVILNTGMWVNKAREPNVVAKELLTKMLDFLKGVATNCCGTIDARSAAVAVKSPEFRAAVLGVEELHHVDLDLLHTNPAKVSFFANVLNLLLAHASLLQFLVEKDEELVEPRLTRHNSLRCLDAASVSSVPGDLGSFSVSSMERIAFLKRNCYSIGQLGVTSAFDIMYYILHAGLIPPSTFGLALQLCFPERPADDPKRKYRPTTPEKRIVFAICDGCVSSPDLQVLDVEGLDVQLTSAVVSYLNTRVSINTDKGQVVLPELLSWYKKDFEKSPLTDSDNLIGDSPPDPEVLLLLQLEPFLHPDLAQQLQVVLPNVKDVTFTPFCWKFAYKFGYTGITESDSSMSLARVRRTSSVPDSLQLSLELLSVGSVESVDHREKYPLNKTTADYLEMTSPLVAAIVGLVCSDDRVLARRALNRNEKDKDKISVTDFPFKGVLERIDKYPVLQRYLVARLYPIAEFLVMSASDHDKIQFSGSYELVRWDPKSGKQDSSLEIPLFSLALAPDGSRELQQAFLKVSDHYLRQGNFHLLLECLDSTSFSSNGSSSHPVDFLLTSAVLSKGGTSTHYASDLEEVLCGLNLEAIGYSQTWRKRPWILLARLDDNEHLTQLVLSKLREWRAKDCMDLLELCLSRPPKSCALITELERRRKELRVYMQITRCAKSPQLRASLADSRPPATSLLTQWQGVAATSHETPHVVMEFLLSLQQYELAAEWAEVENLPSEIHQTIKESQLKHLLESSPEDSMSAYRILESIQEQQMALAICESLLQQNLHVSQTLFIIQFMLTNLYPHLSPVRRKGLLLTKMGAKALLCLPEEARPNYEHLVSSPSLLLEQLLMNLKVDWAERVFARLQMDLTALEECEGSPDHECSSKVFDQLLGRYAYKALEFKVIQPETTSDVPSGLLQGLTQIPSSSPTNLGRATPTPLTSTPNQSPDLKRKTSARMGTLGRSVSTVSAETFRRGGQQTYLPPAIPPRKEEWMPDAQATACVICTEPFGMFNRRHHCRRCGRVVCSVCSPHSCVVHGYGKALVRVCSTCYERIYVPRLHEPDGSPASRPMPQPGAARSLERSIAQESLTGSFTGSSYAHEQEAEDETPEIQWKLQLDPAANAAVREQFYYEQAPSSSLCMAILDLYSDNSACGRLILELCNTLSQILVPLLPGVRNEELDHNLIISMIRYLLFNAKLKMIKAGETQGLELCDTYLGHVDLMKFLVESNCGDIPSLQDLLHPESARRLRDRFIEDERLSLAMEVSTKCGLDPSGVWAAAGFASLSCGDFAAAREKFARCIKPVEGSKQQQQPQSSQYLEKVLDIIQTSPLISFTQATNDLLSPLHDLAEHCKTVSPGSFLDSRRFDECLYYLSAYGSSSAVVSFYVRHGHVKLACRYILDKKCSAEVFVESLLMRLVSRGSLSVLKSQLELTDPTLHSWVPYMTAACRYLHKKGYLNLLYDLQLFMRDYFRAAQTCIRFYESGATSYVELHSRLEHLNKACRHIEAIIAEKRSPRGSALTGSSRLRSPSGSKRSKEDSPNVPLTLSDLNNHLNTINLQVEVTKFMHKCAADAGSTSQLSPGDDGRLPTLFGNGQMRGEVATQVLLAGTSIQDGFTLTCRIIQDYNLPAARVYINTGRALARQYRYQHIQQLLRCVSDTGLVTDKCHDEIILACVRIISSDDSQTKHVDSLIRLLRNDSNKVNAYLLCGKLRSAYLIAVKEKRVEAIEQIAEEAMKVGQKKTLELCKKWLAQYQTMQESQHRKPEPKR
ncbi:zinc finger FYVE domain-containing protein 26-like isoform X2 [Nematostella vectensis]|uniref:zinc finger FYVE domain-containing protein 26-like isoform X2 n=1 Tax=Nematostella vectensis TaxID=45351 RepID=UPI002076DE16|nr:zinc finger FYVE domain-containing protein 26-like isoform X2 [Nematostella vectensis]